MPAEQNETPLVGGLAGVERTGQPDRIHALQNFAVSPRGDGLGLYGRDAEDATGHGLWTNNGDSRRDIGLCAKATARRRGRP